MFSSILTALVVAAAAQNKTLSSSSGDDSMMHCGDAAFCGVLTLETGDGTDKYSHEYPILHGLWPQVPDYGDSACVTPPGDTSLDVSNVMECYTDPDFAQHEWEAHGFCAASKPTVFFKQACTLAKSPLVTMTDMKAAGDSLEDMAAELEKQGYEVWFIDTVQSQLELVCCAASDKIWKMSTVADFTKNCGY